MWWKQKFEMRGEVFFRGGLNPGLHELDGLEKAGVQVTPGTPQADELWRVVLRHPSWGEAQLFAQRGNEPLPRALVEFAPGLTDAEKKSIIDFADSRVSLIVDPTSDDSLRERKRLLRFMHAVMGGDGIASLDALSQIFWTPDRLDDEIAHDAPLDIIQVHVLHLGTEDGQLGNAGGNPSRVTWLHSHGLGEMGFSDFDILRPAPDLTGHQFDVLRAIAFQIVEGYENDQIMPLLGAEPVSLVSAERFMREAAFADRLLRDEQEYHRVRRVVCCDPSKSGFFKKFLGRSHVRPSKLLCDGMDEGRHLVNFSTPATELAAERARETLELFGRFQDEFADLNCGPLVKLGYLTDSGTQDSDKEHLWFEVHGVSDAGIDASLVNEPFDIERMQVGQRATHPIDLLTDWTILTPLGSITPRTTELARSVREVRPRIEDFMKAQVPAPPARDQTPINSKL